MRRTQRIRPTAALVGAVLGAVVLAGCGAGQVSQTARQVTAVDGAAGNAGPIAVRNAQFPLAETAVESDVVYRSNGSAPLEMTIVNTGGTADELVTVSSSALGDGRITGTSEVPAGRAVVVEGEPAAPAAGPLPTGTPAPAVLPTDAPDATGTAQIVFDRLRADISSGRTYEVVLTFRNAGPLRLAVPVAGSTAPRKD